MQANFIGDIPIMHKFADEVATLEARLERAETKLAKVEAALAADDTWASGPLIAQISAILKGEGDE